MKMKMKMKMKMPLLTHLFRTLRTDSRSSFLNATSSLFLLTRCSSDTVQHTWPPSNQLTPLLLQLIRDTLAPRRAHDVKLPINASRTPFPVVLDLTFGNGTHSRAILEEFREDEDLILFAMDRDPKAVELATRS